MYIVFTLSYKSLQSYTLISMPDLKWDVFKSCLLSYFSCFFQTSGSFSFVIGLFFGTVLFQDHSSFCMMIFYFRKCVESLYTTRYIWLYRINLDSRLGYFKNPFGNYGIRDKGCISLHARTDNYIIEIMLVYMNNNIQCKT